MENILNSSSPPAVGIGKIVVAPVPCATFRKIGGRAENTFFLEYCGNLIGTFAVDGHAKDAADYLGGFIVNNPLLRVIRVFLVAVERVNSSVLASHALGAFDCPDFLSGISCKPLVLTFSTAWSIWAIPSTSRRKRQVSGISGGILLRKIVG